LRGSAPDTQTRTPENFANDDRGEGATMKKSVSVVAICFWAVALFYPAVDIWLQWRAITYNPYGSYIPLHTNIAQLLHDLWESIVLVSGGLAAAGFAIELLDQIRWNTARREERQ
jgi:hypothetical protein